MRIDPGLLSQFAMYAETAVTLLLKLPDYPPSRNCGYLAITDSEEDGRIIAVFQIGECPTEKIDRYFKFSLEKAKRLFELGGHMSSWQSQDEKREMYAGAIRTQDLIFSFSGLAKGLEDEAVSLFVAVLSSHIALEGADEIAKISNNTIFTALWQEWTSKPR